MPTADELRALHARVSEAKGPSEELDGLIGSNLGQGPDFSLVMPKVWQPYTASLDAALALVERVLPGWKVRADTGDTTRSDPDARQAYGRVEPYLGNDAGWRIGGRNGHAETAPLAVLCALLLALIAQAETGHGG